MLSAQLVKHNNDDLLVVNAARVSMAKHHSKFYLPSDFNLLRYLFTNDHWTPFAQPQLAFQWHRNDKEMVPWFLDRTPGCETVEVEKGSGRWREYIERGSLWFWLKNRHLLPPHLDRDVQCAIGRQFPHTAEIAGVTPAGDSVFVLLNPFNDSWIAENKARAKIPTLTFRCVAPVAIRTQLYKHKEGLVENEVSRRYVDTDPAFYAPDKWYGSPESLKQGSGGPLPNERQLGASLLYAETCAQAGRHYRALRQLDVCAEQARFVLPQGMLTEWYWTGSLDAFARIVRRRHGPLGDNATHVQKATQHLVAQIHKQCMAEYPVAFPGLLS